MFGNTNSTLLGSKSSAYYFNNQSVATSDWISDTTYSDFSYKATISCPGVSSTDGGMIIYDPAESLSGNYAPVMNTVTNGVEIWSKVNTAITVPTIAIFPAAGGALPSPSTATLVDYSNTTSGLTANNVQGAIDELAIPSKLANNSISVESGFTITHNESYSIGRLKILNLVVTTIPASASQTKICILPNAWKPADETSLNVQWGMSAYLWYAFVGTSGSVYYRPASTSSSTVTVRVFGTYISAS